MVLYLVKCEYINSYELVEYNEELQDFLHYEYIPKGYYYSWLKEELEKKGIRKLIIKL